MYNGHLNPRSPSSPAPIQPPEWMGNSRNRRRTPIAFLRLLSTVGGRNEEERGIPSAESSSKNLRLLM
jgi:hypothetical protein